MDDYKTYTDFLIVFNKAINNVMQESIKQSLFLPNLFSTYIQSQVYNDLSSFKRRLDNQDVIIKRLEQVYYNTIGD